MTIKESGRSSDFIPPSFGHGCLLNCSYCYMKRNKPEGLDYATNIDRILQAITNHVNRQPWAKIPNQTHSKYYTYDISTNEDFALHHKYYDWEFIFNFFRLNKKAMGTLATKIIPLDFLKFNPDKKIRIRFSLMPQEYADVLEPNTAPILSRIAIVPAFIDAGYEVHLNFSPVIYEPDWLHKYKELFEMCNRYIPSRYRSEVKAEVIFLTHNRDKHEYNLENNIEGESLLWNPDIQEDKVSQFKGVNIRYERNFKASLISQFKKLHYHTIPWNEIRYIF